MTDPRRRLGDQGERLAREHLERLGYSTITANHRTRFGELDLVVCDQSTIVFVEVKTRRTTDRASPWEGLHERKRRQVRRMAAAWLAETADRPRAENIRFDAIGVTIAPDGRLAALDHLEAAF